MLEALGVDGMSSDEEVRTQEGKNYFILVSKWRAPVLGPWLRIFDSLYLRHRNREAHGDQRGCLPRRRIVSAKQSTSQKFVPSLPINAYRVDWLEQQLDVPNIVHPAAPQQYTHDSQISEYVLSPLTIFPQTLRDRLKVGHGPIPFTAQLIALIRYAGVEQLS